MITHFRQAIEETLPWLSSFGADPAGGMTRLLYSPEWLETQQQFKKRMAASGLETRFDEVGNLYGRLSGTEYPQEVVLSGSHIDTVVNGGNLDGQFGALAAWLAIDWLKRNTARRYVRSKWWRWQKKKAAASRMSSGAVKISLGWRTLTTCGISVMPKEIVLSMR